MAIIPYVLAVDGWARTLLVLISFSYCLMVAIVQLISQSYDDSPTQATSVNVLYDLAANDDEQRSTTRTLSECQFDNQQFDISKVKFAPQYSSLYFIRLVQVRKMVISRCNFMDMDERKVKLCSSLLEIEDGIDCVIIGTIYKNMKLKPSVIDEYAAENAVAKETITNKTALAGRFVSDDDCIELEDEHARLKLVGQLDIHRLVTGIVVGARGRLLASGEFSVDELILPGLTPNPLPALSTDKFILLMSGLHCGDHSVLPHLMADHITGMVADAQSNNVLKSISRVVICGNAIQMRNELHEDQGLTARPKRIGTIAASQTLPALRTLDLILERLCTSLDVDLMPGILDPTNVALPQQPYNSLFLPRSSRLSSLNLLPNPAKFSVDGVSVYATAGQNVHDILEYTDSMSEMDIIEATYRWRVSCPTCPDTLHCLPFNDRDPFIIGDSDSLTPAPHLYIAGNQSKFDSRLITVSEGHPARLIAVPCFAETGQAVVVNLKNLDCEIIQYSIGR